jgi:hypothetical protein
VKPRHKWEHNIKMDLKEIGYDGVDWIACSSRWGLMAGCGQHGNGLLGSMQYGKFLD